MVPFTPILESEPSWRPVWSQSVAILIRCEWALITHVVCSHVFRSIWRGDAHEGNHGHRHQRLRPTEVPHQELPLQGLLAPVQTHGQYHIITPRASSPRSPGSSTNTWSVSYHYTKSFLSKVSWLQYKHMVSIISLHQELPLQGLLAPVQTHGQYHIITPRASSPRSLGSSTNTWSVSYHYTKSFLSKVSWLQYKHMVSITPLHQELPLQGLLSPVQTHGQYHIITPRASSPRSPGSSTNTWSVSHHYTKSFLSKVSWLQYKHMVSIISLHQELPLQGLLAPVQTHGQYHIITPRASSPRSLGSSTNTWSVSHHYTKSFLSKVSWLQYKHMVSITSLHQELPLQGLLAPVQTHGQVLEWSGGGSKSLLMKLVFQNICITFMHV